MPQADATRNADLNDKHVRTGSGREAFQRAFLDNLYYVQGRFREVATPNDNYMALAYTVRDRLLRNWIATSRTYLHRVSRTVAYLSAEFLMGPHLKSNLLALGLLETAREAMAGLGLDLESLVEQEEEPGLGNGGLGRLAACYLDSLATLGIPSIGYGIRYEFGIFDQEIRDGWQVEMTDKWLHLGNPWEIARPEICFSIPFGGRTEPYQDDQGRYRVRWVPDHVVKGVAYDTPILGYRVANANLLRLWKAEACESFDFQTFNVGDYYGAVHEKIKSENITKVLYPNDAQAQGRRLRLEQQYFFVSCSLRDMIRIHRQADPDLTHFAAKYAVQLNDTHPAVAVAELMRLLVDEHQLGWDQAWDVTRRTFAYTNHTLMPEALERWGVDLFGWVLPRHLEIIYEVNRRFLDEVRVRFPGDEGRVARLSLIGELGERHVRMANLATLGSHAVNGVSRLHSELLTRYVLKDFHGLEPGKFQNVTNGVTPRRFLLLANPRLASLISEAIGDGWVSDLDALEGLEKLADDAAFRARWRAIKGANKADLAGRVRARTGIPVDAGSLLDVQIKRIHEYKRQHLNALHVVTLYNRMKRNPGADFLPRTVLFAGKAAPGYFQAKLIIKLISSIAQVVNRDPELKGRLRVVFYPDYNVTESQRIIPAAELSEQISTAGMEASGTGNMKLALNGALTIGTLDGANIEIREKVGEECFFTFGLSIDEVERRRARGYRPRDLYEGDPELREAIDLIASGQFSCGDGELYRPLLDSFLEHDPYFVLADYGPYVAAQDRVQKLYGDPEAWTRLSIRTTARMGYFSSDRAIREYCERIWDVRPVSVSLDSDSRG